MDKKAEQIDRKSTKKHSAPTPAEIAKLCRRIQQEWTPEERLKRKRK